MTIKEYDLAIKQIDKKLYELHKKKFDLTKEFNNYYFQCSKSSCLRLENGRVVNTYGRIIDTYEKGLRHIPCGEYFDRKDVFKVSVKKLERSCVYEDEWDSCDNVYQIVYAERTYFLCPKCKTLHNEQNVYNIIEKFNKRYHGYRSTSEINIDMKKYSKNCPEEISIYDCDYKLIEHFINGVKMDDTL